MAQLRSVSRFLLFPLRLTYILVAIAFFVVVELPLGVVSASRAGPDGVEKPAPFLARLRSDRRYHRRWVLAFGALLLIIAGVLAYEPVRYRAALWLVSSEDAGVRRRAAAVLVLRPYDKRTLPAICRAVVREEDPDVRGSLTALIEPVWNGSGNSVDCFERLLMEESDPAARGRAAESLIPLAGRDSVVPALARAAVTDDDPNARQKILALLADRVPRGALLRSAWKGDAAVVAGAARAFARGRSTASMIEALPTEGVWDSAAAVRVAALADRGEATVAEPLARSLGTAMPLPVRGLAAEALVRLKQGDSIEIFLDGLTRGAFSSRDRVAEALTAMSAAARDRVVAWARDLPPESRAEFLIAFRFSDVREHADGPLGEDVELTEAMRRGWVTVRGRGAGITRVRLVVARLVDGGFRARVEPGVILVCATKSQNMVVLSDEVFDLRYRRASSAYVQTACAQMHRPVPGNKDWFNAIVPAKGELRRVLPLLAKQPFEVAQAAVWILTDNADRSQMRQLVDRDLLTARETPQIRDEHAVKAVALLRRAGVDLSGRRIMEWYERRE